MNRSVWVNVTGEDWREVAGSHVRDGESAHPAVPFDQGGDRVFRRDWAKRPIVRFTADPGFIRLDSFTLPAQGSAERPRKSGG
jgi:hypothetical protein